MSRPIPRTLRLAAVLLAAVLWTGCGDDAPTTDPQPPPAPTPPPSGLARGSVTVGMHRVEVELARTADEQRQGLSGRRHLSEGSGMLFPYASPSRPGFWMKNMFIDIDIVWIAGGRIVGIESQVPHAVQPPLPVYRPPTPVDAVLEVPAGTAERLGWRAGDPVVIER